MQTQAFPRSRQQNIVMQDLGKEILLYDLTTHKAFNLNETSALVWQECDGKKDISQISQIISQKLKMPANEDLVWLAIDELKKENLLENESELVSVFKGVSRREVIRKVGLGTMIALPIISTLVAPSSSMALSAISLLGGPCISDLNCDDPSVPNIFCCGGSQATPPVPSPGNPPIPGNPEVIGFCFDPGDGDCGVTN